ncbi:Hemicentin-2 [Eumeta japonica]|uniref:Hemicentin-2 n=1 Tax=Eumeta variegata TaxID=151549 RepID=A0A4C1ZQ12_EUMVA|nr:Hemicentin-2 [Eumeta japonica]
MKQIGMKSGTGTVIENEIVIRIMINSVIDQYIKWRNTFYVHAGGTAGSRTTLSLRKRYSRWVPHKLTKQKPNTNRNKTKHKQKDRRMISADLNKNRDEASLQNYERGTKRQSTVRCFENGVVVREKKQMICLNLAVYFPHCYTLTVGVKVEAKIDGDESVYLAINYSEFVICMCGASVWSTYARRRHALTAYYNLEISELLLLRARNKCRNREGGTEGESTVIFYVVTENLGHQSSYCKGDPSVTSDANTFRKEIDRLQANTNEVAEENPLAIMLSAADAASTGSLLYIFTDVLASDYDNNSQLWEVARQKKLQLNFIDSSASSKSEEELSRKPDGQIFIENKIPTLTLTVACHRPFVIMKGENGKKVKLNRLESTSYKQVLRASSELQGNYLVRVRCRSKGELSIHGDVDVVVHVGFSMDKPTTMMDTRPMFTYAPPPMQSTEPPAQLMSDMQEPMIDKTTDHVETVQGSPLKLKCLTRGHSTPKISWYFDSKITGIKEDLSINADVLEFPQVQRNQSGIYICEAKNAAGLDSHSIDVTVYYPPIITKKPVNIFEANAGSVVKLFIEYEANPEANVAWTFDGDQMNGESYIVDNENHLTFIAEPNKAGLYECTVSNNYGSETATILLIVKDIEVPNKIEYVEEGTPVKLTCPIYGTSALNMSWTFTPEGYKDSRTLKETSDSLQYTETTIENSGTYTCNVEGMRKNAVSIVLKVVYKPKIVTGPPRLIQVKLNETVNLTVDYTADPEASVTWIFNDEIINGDEYRIDPENNLIFEASPNNVGTYEYVIKNEYGSTRGVTEVKIQDKPKINQSPPPTLRVVAGELVSLTVDFSANPEAIVTWTFNGATLTGNDNFHIYPDNTITFVALPEFTGTYMYNITNEFGSTDGSTYVEIQNPFTDTQADVVLTKVDDTVTLTCPVNFLVQTLNVQWMFTPKGSSTYKILEETNKTLKIPHVNEEECGVYTCSVKGIHETKDFVVDIGRKPQIERITPPVIQVKLGELVNLTVNYTASPDTAAKWIFKNSTVTADDGYSIYPENSLTFTATHEREESSQVKNEKVIINAAEGVNVAMKCPMDSSLPTSVSWSFTPKWGSVPEVHEETNAQLLIDNVDFMQSGSYVCDVKNTSTHKEFELNVNHKPKIKKRPLPILLAQCGEEIILTVEYAANPQASVIWYHNEEIANEGFYQIHPENTLRFTAFSESAGRYLCVVENDYGSAKIITQLIVQDKPKILKSPQSIVNVKMGESVVLRVNYEANPKASVRWIFDDNSVTGDNYDVYPDNTLTLPEYVDSRTSWIFTPKGSNSHVSLDETDPFLQIFNVNRTHTGTYTCQMNGMNYKHFELEIWHSPEVIKRPSSVIKASRGEWITLSVEYAASPAAVATWTFNGRIITGHNQQIPLIDNFFHYVVLQAEGGVCECTITSCYGSVKILVEILIQDSTGIAGESNLFPEEGSPVTLTCPNALDYNTSWSFISEETKSVAVLSETTTTLQIPSAVSGHSDRPRVTAAPPRLIRVKPSERVTLTVEYRSSPKADVSWSFNGNPVIGGNYRIHPENTLTAVGGAETLGVLSKNFTRPGPKSGKIPEWKLRTRPHFKKPHSYRRFLEIRNIQIPQSGKYICVTESHIHTFEVIVQYRPVVLYRSPLVVRSKKGDPVELVVDYDAKPAAVVTWTRGRRPSHVRRSLRHEPPHSLRAIS